MRCALHVLALRVDLRFPNSQSLKAKRACLRPIVDGLRAKFDVSVAETDHADSWQRAELGVALVSGDVHVVGALADDIERFIWRNDADILEIERLWLETER